MDIEINGDVKFYPYRTARARDIFMTLPRTGSDPLELRLAELAGVRPDNHTVFEIARDGQPTVYIWCHDLAFFFGFTLDEGRH